MLYYYTTDLSEGIDVPKSNNSDKCIVVIIGIVIMCLNSKNI